LYIYYENYCFSNGSKNYFGRAFYTHQITVHENQSQEQYEKLKEKHFRDKVSYSKGAKRVYIRVLARRVKFNRMLPSHPHWNRSTQPHWAEVRNYLLNIFYRIDYENGDKIIGNVLD